MCEVRSWYVLQGLYPKGFQDDESHIVPLEEDKWLDLLSLKHWKNPKIRAEALAAFRAELKDEPDACKKYQMVKRTEKVLDE